MNSTNPFVSDILHLNQAYYQRLIRKQKEHMWVAIREEWNEQHAWHGQHRTLEHINSILHDSKRDFLVQS
jgi:hypothetical protein